MYIQTSLNIPLPSIGGGHFCKNEKSKLLILLKLQKAKMIFKLLIIQELSQFYRKY